MTADAIAIIALFGFTSVVLFAVLISRSHELIFAQRKIAELDKKLTELLKQLS